MPILFSKKLPATKILIEKRVFVMGLDRATHQDIRPLEIAIVNLMPKKEDTEAQLLRVIGNGPLQIHPTFVSLNSYTPKNTKASHLEKFYKPFSEIQYQSFDGLILTGAPVENLAFEKVAYWNELKDIFEWAKKRVTSSLFICWGAQAALYYYYGIEKYTLEKKCFGIFPHTHSENSELLRGLDDSIFIPISRHTEVKKKDLEEKNIRILVESDVSGVAIATHAENSQIFSFGHLEYDRTTLLEEYVRDIEKEEKIDIPKNYFPNNNPQKTPILSWRANGERFFQNWINAVYQKTPYHLSKMEKIGRCNFLSC